jgi:hypothetical protein
MALRLELAVLAASDPFSLRVDEVLNELINLPDIATCHDYDREETSSRLLAAGIRTPAFRRLLELDRENLVHLGPRKMKRSITEVDGWLAQL